MLEIDEQEKARQMFLGGTTAPNPVQDAVKQPLPTNPINTAKDMFLNGPPKVEPTKPIDRYDEMAMSQDTELMDSLRNYYARDGQTFDSDTDMLDDWVNDMRWIDNNVVSATSRLMEIRDAQSKSDKDMLNMLKVQHDRWNKKSTIFGDDFATSFEGIIENVGAGLLDPTSALYFIPGLNAVKAGTTVGARFALTTALDGALTASLNYLNQQAQSDLGLRDGVSVGEVAGAFALGTVPGLAIKTGQQLGKAGSLAYNQAFNQIGDLQKRASSIDRRALSRLKGMEEASDFVRNFSVQNKETGHTPYVLFKQGDMKQKLIDPATNQPMLFKSLDDAVTYANTNLLGVSSPNPLLKSQYQKNNPSGWRVDELRFKDVKDAKKFISKSGSLLGSDKTKDYTLFYGDMTSPEGFGPLASLNKQIQLKLQQHADQYLFHKSIMKEGKALIKREFDNTTDSTLKKELGGLLADDPVTLLTNNYNSTIRGWTFLNLAPIKIADDVNNQYAKMYDIIPEAKSLSRILEGVYTKLKDQGFDDFTHARKEFGAYVFAKRLLNEERKGINTGAVIAEQRAFVRSIQADPMRQQIYDQAIDELKVFNKYALEYARDSGLYSQEYINTLLRGNPAFLPIARLDDGSGRFYVVHRGSAANTVKKAISKTEKARGQDMLDPLESYSQEIIALIRSADENRARLQTYNFMKAAGGHFSDRYFKKISNAAAPIKVSVKTVQDALDKMMGSNAPQVNAQNLNVMTLWAKDQLMTKDYSIDVVFNNGKMEYYKIHDVLMWDSIKGAGEDLTRVMRNAATGKLTKGMRAYNELFATFITHNPFWNLGTALPADAITTWILKPYTKAKLSSEILDLPIINVMRGISQSIKNDDYARFLINGGGLSGIHSNTRSSFKNQLLQHARRQGFDPQTVMGLGRDLDIPIMDRIQDTLTPPFAAIANKSENAARYNTFLNEINRGVSYAQAARTAAESSIDFRARGSSYNSAQIQRAIAPFFRARVNSMYQHGRALFNINEPGQSAYRLFKLGLLTVAPAMMLETIWDHLDSEGSEEFKAKYRALPTNFKDQYFFVPVPPTVSDDGMLKIRKYPDTGFASNFMHRWRTELERSEEGRSVWKLVSEWAWATFGAASGLDNPAPSFMPPMASTLYQAATGEKRGVPIDRQGDQKRSGALRGTVKDTKYYWANSPEFRAAVDDVNRTMGMNMSPEQAVVFAEGLMATIVSATFTASDFLYKNKTGVYTFDWRELPGIKNVYKSGRVQRYTSYDERLYEYNDYITNMQADIAYLQATGDPNAQALVNERIQEPKYQNYLKAEGLLKEAIATRQEHMKWVNQYYIQNWDKMKERDLEDIVDQKFEANNAVMKTYVEQIEALLSSKDKANK